MTTAFEIIEELRRCLGPDHLSCRILEGLLEHAAELEECFSATDVMELLGPDVRGPLPYDFDETSTADWKGTSMALMRLCGFPSHLLEIVSEYEPPGGERVRVDWVETISATADKRLPQWEGIEPTEDWTQRTHVSFEGTDRWRIVMEAARRAKSGSLLERILELANSVPDEAFEDQPTDIAANHDHYLCGRDREAQDTDPIA